MSTVVASQSPASRISRRAITISVTLLAAAAFLFSIRSIFVGFHHSIFDFHGFRQAQTAITAEYMEHGGPFLRYQTPVFGPPWSIPFEFPLYQKIVALLAAHLHTPLNETGRAVSIAFFYLCFLPLTSILERLRYKRFQILAILSLLAASPLYILVSRLFMIESTALFFSLMYAEQMVRLLLGDRPWQYRHMAGAALAGVLAGMVKVTTFTPFFALGLGLALWKLLTLHKRDSPSVARIAWVVALCAAIPGLCTILWTHYADTMKSENPIGRYFTSKILAPWNFGTVAQRLRWASYVHFFHAVAGQAGSILLLALLVVLYAVMVRRWNWPAVVSFALYLFTPLVFFGLHLIHEYYPYASAIFLLVGAGLLIADLLTLPGCRAWAGVIALAALLSACGLRYHSTYYPIQRSNAPGRPDAAALIDNTTGPDSVIVITGMDWSPELPFQSHRRSIVDPGSAQFWAHSSLGPISAAIRNEGAESIAEVVACDTARGTDRTGSILRISGLNHSTPEHADDCDIYPRSLNSTTNHP